MTIVVDYTEAIDKAGGNTELAKELFGMLLQELPALRDQLELAIKQADLPAIRDHSHKIHGSTAYCGVPQLRAAASEMEIAVKGQQLMVISGQFAILKQAIQLLLAQGHTHLNEAW